MQDGLTEEKLTEEKGTPEKRSSGKWLFLLLGLLGLGLIIPLTMSVLDHKPAFKVDKYEPDQQQFKNEIATMVQKYTVRYEGEGEKRVAIVHPPAGSDIYMLAKNYDWGDYILELEKGKTYRWHIASFDMKHAIVVRPLNIMNRVKRGKAIVLTITPQLAGKFDIVCGEFCGPGHGSMNGKLYIIE